MNLDPHIAHMAQYYQKQYGTRTNELLKALLSHEQKIALLNPFINPEQLEELKKQGEGIAFFNNNFIKLPAHIAPFMIDGLLSHYFLDASSVIAPLNLPILPHMRVLDMCSAPGGKLLVMLSRMVEDVFFVANDLSLNRSNRLRQVLTNFVPEGFINAYIKVSSYDAVNFGLKQKNSFDAILLDAPCSHEAHILKSPSHLQKFKGPQKSLAMRQYALLSAALLALKPGGHVMYSTCSINQAENDGVLSKLFKKKGDTCELVTINSPIGHKTDFGLSILPHIDKAGPAYLCLIKKKAI